AGVVAAADLVEQHGGVAPVEPGAAPLRVVAQAEHAELAHRAVERLVDPTGSVELPRAGPELLLHELPHRAPEELVLVGAIQIAGHGRTLASRSEIVEGRDQPSGAGLSGRAARAASPPDETRSRVASDRVPAAARAGALPRPRAPRRPRSPTAA